MGNQLVKNDGLRKDDAIMVFALVDVANDRRHKGSVSGDSIVAYAHCIGMTPFTNTDVFCCIFTF